MTKSQLSSLTLVLGAARSGKSEYAENLFKQSDNVLYVATFKSHSKDEHWEQRIKVHKQRRPLKWKLIENYMDINLELQKLPKGSNIIIDSLGGIVYQYLSNELEIWNDIQNNFILSLNKIKGNIVIVIEEVGWGISSADSASNLFIDRLGELTQKLNAICNQSFLIIHGKALNLNHLSATNE